MLPRVLLLFASFFTFISIGFAYEGRYYLLPGEPLIRIGLSTNASSASITTDDAQLVAYSPEEPSRFLSTNRVSVSARSYRPPEVENYRFEIQNIATSAEADEIAKDLREATGQSASASVDAATNTWKVWVGGVFETTEEADAFKALLRRQAIGQIANQPGTSEPERVERALTNVGRDFVEPHSHGASYREADVCCYWTQSVKYCHCGG